jgi:integrase
VEALERPSTEEARALTDEECRAWLMILDGSELACQADLPDLVRFLLGTGCRIGEALALTRPNVDLERHLINIDSTLIREGSGPVDQASEDEVQHPCASCAAFAGRDFA